MLKTLELNVNDQIVNMQSITVIEKFNYIRI